MNSELEKHVELLGFPLKDKVTGQTGVATSISFDLYGCIQVAITPLTKDGTVNNGNWFDVGRIEKTGNKRVLPLPNFHKGYVAEGKKGASPKPTMVTNVINNK